MARTMGEGALRLWKAMGDDEAVAAEGGRRDGGGMAAPAPASSSLSLFIFTLFNSSNCLPSVHGLKYCTQLEEIYCQFALFFRDIGHQGSNLIADQFSPIFYLFGFFYLSQSSLKMNYLYFQKELVYIFF
jgi:hypothetical protein